MTKRNSPPQKAKNGRSNLTDEKTVDSVSFRQQNRSCILFGITGGFFISLLSFLRAVSAENWTVFIWFTLLVVGFLMIITALIYPLALYPVQKLLSLIVGWTLRGALTILLSVLYVVYFIPAGLILRTNRKRFGFFEWKDKAQQKNTYFVEKVHTERLENERKREKKYGAGEKIRDRIFLLREHGLLLLLPLIIFLFILGILFAFASSGIAEYFIYTLF